MLTAALTHMLYFSARLGNLEFGLICFLCSRAFRAEAAKAADASAAEGSLTSQTGQGCGALDTRAVVLMSDVWVADAVQR